MAEDATQTTNNVEESDWQIVGKVSHFFDRIQVAAISLSGVLKVGDRIKFAKASIEQTVSSMQIEGTPVEIANVNDQIGIKVEGLAEGQKIKEGDKVLKAA